MEYDLEKVAEDSARGGFFLISGTAISTVIMAVSSILIGRFLGPELYGQYTLTMVVPQLLFLFTDLGISQGVIKFTASLRSKGEVDRIPQIIKYGLILRASVGFVVSIINYALADFFASFMLQRPELTFYVRLVSICIIFQVIYTTVTSAFVGLDRTEYNALTTNIQATVKAIISISLVLLGFSVTGAVIGYVAGYVIAAVVGISILFILIRKKEVKQSANSLSDLKILISYGAPLYISALLSGFIPTYQNIMLAFFTTDADIGNYKAATNFIALMSILTVPITTTLLPAFSKINSLTNQKIKEFYKIANKYTAMVIVPLAFLIIIFSREIVEIIYGSTYQSAPIFLAIYCLLYLSVGIGYIVLPSLYNGLGQTKTTLKMSLTTLLVLAVLSPILTKTYSVPGLIIAFITASTVGTIYGFYVARINFKIELTIKTQLKIYLNSAVSSIPAILVLSLASSPKILNVAIGGLLYLLTYLTLIPLTKTMTLQELRKTLRITQKIPSLAIIAKPIILYQQKLLQIMQKHAA
ncbi:MAG: flippase [Candidatus Bathyarchaeales archaeon]